MSPNLHRGLLLYQQSRYEMAETELRQALAENPDEPQAHAFLALCLMHREKFAEATQEAQQAIHLGPDFSFTHYALAQVWHTRNYNDRALEEINEAIRLDPEDSNYLALLAQIELSERNWTKALDAAERGLQYDPGHVACTNLRAMALVKLGRKAEAGRTIDTALARDPDNSFTHANQGWTLLEKGDAKKALEHFRESLRLDPENEWARRGIVEALKARNFIYAWMLRYFLFISKFRRQGQWAIVLGAYFGNQALGQLARSVPEMAPWVLPIRILYCVFALMTWIASPLFNLMLRVNRFGRYALSREQTVASNWLGLCLLLGLVAFGGWVATGFQSVWLFAALVFGLLLLPVSAIFRCTSGWPRLTMAAYTIVTALAGIGAATMIFLYPMQPVSGVSMVRDTTDTLFWIFIVGAIGSTWVANFLMTRRTYR
jgi:tetratricopeptide (TPR) repeat protein